MAACLKESLLHCHDALNAASRYAQGPPTAPWRQNWESQWRWYAHPPAEGGCSSSTVEGGTWVAADFPFSYSFFLSFCNSSTYFSFLLPYMLSHLFLYDTMMWVLKLSLFWKKNKIELCTFGKQHSDGSSTISY